MAVDPDAVIADLALEEKVALTLGSDFWHTAGVERHRIPPILVADGPHGLRVQQDGPDDDGGLYDSEPATCFPTAAALGSSWDPDLTRTVGQAIGREAVHAGVGVVLGPGINMKRSPLCGRNFEYFSEDPVLAGNLATALVQGIQSQGVGTSVKHFAANNQETDRVRIDAQVDQRTLREIYLPAFEQVITEAEPWTVMCSYNRLNGIHASQHRWLLTELLRDEWGFDGLVMSDWGAVHDRVAALRAGLDLEMPPAHGHSDVAVLTALRSGELKESVLDAAVRRVLQLVGRVAGTEDDAVPPAAEDHHRLARRAATESAVLLKNDQDLLPLDPGGTTRLLVVGAFAAEPRFQGSGSSRVNPTKIDIPIQELRAAAPDLTIDCLASHDPGAAVEAAREADVVLAFLGLPSEYESEGFDRTHIDLPPDQLELITALGMTDTPVAAVLSNGSAVAVAGWEQHATAILECWLGGQAAGGAMADLIFGRANPSGRLAETIPLRLQHNPSYLNFPGEHGAVRYGEGVFIGYRGYEAAEQPVSYPFGHGLSYTSFAIGDLSAEQTGSVAGGNLRVVVAATVANTGDRLGAEVVQLYVGDRQASVARPPKELKHFAKITLEPGEQQRVQFVLAERDFAYWSTIHDRWVVEAGDFEISVGSSSRDLADRITIAVDAPSVAGPLTGWSSLAEWLADPTGRALLERDPRVAGQLEQTSEEMLMLIKSMPIATVARFGMFGPAELDDLLDRAGRSE